ncbi:MAG: hypothetical protein ABIR35_09530 [Polaromonas sp.]
MTRIVALWPTPKVLEVIEESTFRKPDSKSEVFSLAAYRELLLLHAIAKKVVTPSASPKLAARNTVGKPAPAGFVNTNSQPLSDQLKEGLPNWPIKGQADKRNDPTRPPASRHLGLDIDLNFDFGDPEGKPHANAGLGDHEMRASYTHELLEFEAILIDRPPRPALVLSYRLTCRAPGLTILLGMPLMKLTTLSNAAPKYIS